MLTDYITWCLFQQVHVVSTLLLNLVPDGQEKLNFISKMKINPKVHVHVHVCICMYWSCTLYTTCNYSLCCCVLIVLLINFVCRVGEEEKWQLLPWWHNDWVRGLYLLVTLFYCTGWLTPPLLWFVYNRLCSGRRVTSCVGSWTSLSLEPLSMGLSQSLFLVLQTRCLDKGRFNLSFSVFNNTMYLLIHNDNIHCTFYI